MVVDKEQRSQGAEEPKNGGKGLVDRNIRWRDEGEGRQDSGGSRVFDTIGLSIPFEQQANDDFQTKGESNPEL